MTPIPPGFSTHENGVYPCAFGPYYSTTLQPLSVASTSLERLNVANNEIVQVDQVGWGRDTNSLREHIFRLGCLYCEFTR